MPEVVIIDFRSDGRAVFRETKGIADNVERIGDEAQDSTRKVGLLGRSFERLRSAGRAIIRGTIAAGFAAIGAAIGAIKLGQLGSELEEIENQFNEVFRGSQTLVENLDEFRERAGLTASELQELTASSGATAQGLGFTVEQSEKLAEVIALLGGDLASFRNVQGGSAEVIERINKALVGQREGLDALNINLLESQVQQKALELTGKTTTSAINEQEKAVATLALITEKAGVAIGDLERTESSTANQTRQFQARIRELTNVVAGELVEGFGEGVRAANELVDNPDFRVGVERTARLVGSLISSVVKAIQTGLAAVRQFYDDNGSAAEGFINLIKFNFNLVSVLVKTVGLAIVRAISTVVTAVGEWARDNREKLEGISSIYRAFATIVAFAIERVIVPALKAVGRAFDIFLLTPLAAVGNASRRLGEFLGFTGQEAEGAAKGVEMLATATQENTEAGKEAVSTTDQLSQLLAELSETTNTSTTNTKQNTKAQQEQTKARQEELKALESKIKALDQEFEKEAELERLRRTKAESDRRTAATTSNQEFDQNLRQRAAARGDALGSGDVPPPSAGASEDDELRNFVADAIRGDFNGTNEEFIARVDSLVGVINAQGEVLQQAGADFANSLAAGLESGDFSNFGASILNAFGKLASQLGTIYIQFALAGRAIKPFIRNPALAFAAGVALKVLGRRLTRTAQRTVDNFAASGGSTSGGIINPIGQRTGAVPGITPAAAISTVGRVQTSVAPRVVVQQTQAIDADELRQTVRVTTEREDALFS